MSEIETLIEDSEEIKIFLNSINSYHGQVIANELLLLNSHIHEKSESIKLENEQNNDEVISIADIVSELKSENKEENDIRKKFFKIYGTIENRIPCENLSNEIIILNKQEKKDKNLINSIIECDFIIFDINLNLDQVYYGHKILMALENQIQHSNSLKMKYFILISSIMTWAETGKDLISDKEYRKRRSHVCYMKHMNLEREVINTQMKYPSNIQTIVLCPGVTYGGVEDIFHYLFKSSYLNQSNLEIFGNGLNTIPVIYIKDLAKIIKQIIENFPNPKLRYILAIQPKSINYFKFAKMIGKSMCGEHCTILPIDKSNQIHSISQRVINYCTINLNLKSIFLENFKFNEISNDIYEYGLELGMEYRKERNLRPIKILISGPPCSGKSDIAKALSKYYGIFHVDFESLTQILTNQYQNQINHIKNYIEDIKQYEHLTNEIEDLEELLHELNEKLKEISKKQFQQNFDYDFQKYLIHEILSFKSHSENQGYVFDGFPFDYNQSNDILTLEGKEDPKLFFPNYVILLDGDDDVFKERAMNIPEIKSFSSKNTEKEFFLRLKEFRDLSHDDISLLNYFLDQNIIPLEFEITKITKNDEIISKIIKSIGEPSIIVPMSLEEKLRKQKLDIQEKKRYEKELKKIQEERDLMEQEKRETKIQEWSNKIIKLKSEEQKLIENQSLSLRNYLIQYIMPALTKALAQVTILRPNDPIDFIAEFLLKYDLIEQNQKKIFDSDLNDGSSNVFDFQNDDEIEVDFKKCNEFD